MKVILFLIMACSFVDAQANYTCVKTKDGVLICRPIVIAF
jgi:hypothetical protein